VSTTSHRPPVPPPAATALKTVAALALLQSALPLNLALTGAALLRSAVLRSAVLRPGGLRPGEVRPGELRSAPAAAPDPKTILVSGGKMTKALQLARSFHAAGHRVILVESAKYRLTGHRFSRAVDRFYTVPSPQAAGYTDALLEIVRKENVDVYVPVCSPAASYHDAQAKLALAGHCEVVHADPETIRGLDDKDQFAATARSLGLRTPDTYRVTSPQQVLDLGFPGPGRPYILKSIPYDPVERLDLTRLPQPAPAETAAFVRAKPISGAKPWILQSFIQGTEYCTHSTVRDGEVQLHCCCRSSAFQVNYESVDKPEIEAWVRRFVGALNLTGQFSFDFIEAGDGQVYAIECNPRTHSAITMFYNHPGVAAAYLEPDGRIQRPLGSSRPTYWMYHELWRMISRPTQIAERLKVITRGKEAIFDWSDPLPFLMVHHVQIPSLLLKNLRHRKDWIRIDFNIGKLVEPAGD
jgi:predicted ATP-grasp superfamily ATP-dependent carboligase